MICLFTNLSARNAALFLKFYSDQAMNALPYPALHANQKRQRDFCRNLAARSALHHRRAVQVARQHPAVLEVLIDHMWQFATAEHRSETF
jgi:hypothetical protein